MGFFKKKTAKEEIKITNRENGIESNPDSTLLEALISAKVKIHHSCEGNASCGTCRVLVEKGLEDLPARSELEQEFVEGRGFPDNERLACQIPAQKGLVIKILS